MPHNDLARRLRDQLAAHPAPQAPQSWLTAHLPRTEDTDHPLDVARDALGISEKDAAALLDADLLPEQLIAALDQLSDGAPAINWEVAYAAAYGLEDGDFSVTAEHQARRRVWGVTHDLITDGTRRSGSRGLPPGVMQFIVAGWVEDCLGSGWEPAFWRDERGVWRTANGDVYAPRLTEAAVIYPGSMQGTDDALAILGTSELTWVGVLGDRRLHHAIVPLDKLSALGRSRHIRTHGTPAPDTVYTYLHTSWLRVTGDTCQRCGTVAFLARATDWPGSPALCPDCHEAMRTAQAAAGHQCADGCTQPVDHTGLCLL
ncbi:hypothetical protein ACFVV7_34030 [Streptomyces globisporus]|uniref:hypothetical protein n=1 Tax=Streptomyces globisporus TaxID=1908 RepID=UPI0036DC9397